MECSIEVQVEWLTGELSVVVRWRKQLGGLVGTACIPPIPTLVRARWLAAPISRRDVGERSRFAGQMGLTERAERGVDGEVG